MVHDAVDETEDVVFKDLPLKETGVIFIVTFVLVFVVFTMVEPFFHCSGTGGAGGCQLAGMMGTFILGLMISGALFLLDMTLLYMILSEYLM